MKRKTITINQTTYTDLKTLSRPGQSFDGVITELIDLAKKIKQETEEDQQ